MSSTDAAGASAPVLFSWTFGRAEFDEARRELRVGGAVAEIEPRPLDILACLLRHAGETVTKEELFEAVWGHGHLSETVLTNAVGKLRRVLGDEEQVQLVTLRGVGYRLAVPVVRKAIAGPQDAPPSLRAGDAMPGREHWRLQRALGISLGVEVWLARHAKTGELRVYKCSPDGRRLHSLKREATLYRLLRQSLGDHPGFAAVIDWNFDSPPYFLECAYGGLSLPEWLQSLPPAQAPDPEQRVELLARIADIVADAHSVGVLHKDLKPANVLIYQAEDGVWKPRLTDFGSSVLDQPERLEEYGITRLGFTVDEAARPDSRSGTPLYLAPELLGGAAPSVRSDIYALGVMLYQFALGDLRRPFAPGWESEVQDELLREDIALAADGQSARRLASATELAQRLRTRPQRRQARAEARAAEQRTRAIEQALQRARARRPLTIAVIVSLALGVAASLWFYRQAAAARDQARSQLLLAEQVQSFVNGDLLAAANPNVAGSENLTVRAAIDRAAGQIDRQFAKTPAAAAAMQLTVGDAYHALGDNAHAGDAYRRAMTHAAASGLGGARTALVARFDLAGDLAFQGKYDEAKGLLDQLNPGQRRALAADPILRLREFGAELRLKLAQNDDAHAVTFGDEALALIAQLHNSDPQALAAEGDLEFQIRQLAVDAADYALQREKAEALDRALIADLTAARGPNHPLTLLARELLVYILTDEGRLDDTERLLPDLVRDAEAVLSEGNPTRLNIVQSQADLLSARHRYVDAVVFRRQYEQAVTSKFGLKNPNTITAKEYLGRDLANAGDHAAAVAKLHEALDLSNGLLGKDDSSTQHIMTALIDVELNAENAQEAGPMLDGLNRKALADIDPVAASQSWFDYQNGRVARLRGDAKAAELFQAALKELPADKDFQDLGDRIRSEVDPGKAH